MKKIYKLITKSKTIIPIESREEIDAIVKAANAGARLLWTKYGVIDSSSIDCIVVDKEKMAEVGALMRLKTMTDNGLIQKDEEAARREVLGESPFQEEPKKLK